MSEEIEPRFETALEQLEAIFESLERGEPELSAALAKHETNVRLLNQCYGLLERAERSVALLTGLDAKGKSTTVAFVATATIEMESTQLAHAAESPSAPVAIHLSEARWLAAHQAAAQARSVRSPFLIPLEFAGPCPNPITRLPHHAIRLSTSPRYREFPARAERPGAHSQT